jgi:hypothetical protein
MRRSPRQHSGVTICCDTNFVNWNSISTASLAWQFVRRTPART